MPFSAEDNLVGTDRLVCDPRLDAPPTVETAGSFMGTFPSAAGFPAFTIGLSDMSIEMILLQRTGDIATLIGEEPSGVGMGNIVDDSPLIGVEPFSRDSSAINAFWRGVLGTFVQLAGFNFRSAWTHLSINYDRSGDMEFFDNGVSVGTSSIAVDVALVIASDIISPMAIGPTDNASFAEWFTPLGGFAIHSRLLTAPEIAANVAALNVGSYAETEARYRFTSFVDSGGSPITPVRDTDITHVGAALTWTLPIAQANSIYVPEGVDGTVFIEDLSGNGRHFGIATDPSYADSDGSRARNAFSTEVPA